MVLISTSYQLTQCIGVNFIQVPRDVAKEKMSRLFLSVKQAILLNCNFKIPHVFVLESNLCGWYKYYFSQWNKSHQLALRDFPGYLRGELIESLSLR